MAQSDMEWDLSPMVNGAKASEVRKLLASIAKQTEKFVEDFSRKIDSMTAADIKEMLGELETLRMKTWSITGYCQLRFWADSTNKEAAQLMDWSQRTQSQLGQKLTILDIELGRLVEKNPEILNNREIENYRHYLEQLLSRTPYRLSTKEEQLVIEKDINGIVLMSQLRGAWLSEKVFELEIDGKSEQAMFSKLLSLRGSPNRELRKKASYILHKSLAEDKLLYSYAFRAVTSNHVDMCKLRGMASPMTQSLLDEDVDEETVQTLLSTIEATSDRFRDFLQMKAEILGVEKLAGYDVYAPIAKNPVWRFSWADARRLVIASYRAFDADMGQIVEDMFANNRIDAVNRVGKNNWAYCWGWPSGKSSFVIMTFNGSLGDVYSLAHENGHAVQSAVTYRDQTPLNYRASSCIGEMGSIFGELLLTDKLLGISETDNHRRELLAHVLDSYFFHVYHIGARAFFELSVYDAVAEGRLIDADTTNNLWNAAKRRIYGDYVEWSEFMEYEWARTAHNFVPTYRFYNYPYSFGQMLVFTLYDGYKKEKAEFVPRFKHLLGLGSSMSPRDQLLGLGYDISKPSFWELGGRQADRFLEEFRKLV